MDLRDYLNILFRRWVWAVAVVILFFAGGWFLTTPAKPVYTATIEFNLHNKNFLIVVDPSKYFLSDYTSENSLRQLLRSDEFFNAAQANIANNLPQYSEYNNPEQGTTLLKTQFEFNFDDRWLESSQQINALKMSVTTQNSEQSKKVLDQIKDVFEQQANIAATNMIKEKITIYNGRIETQQENEQELVAQKADRENETKPLNTAEVVVATIQTRLAVIRDDISRHQSRIAKLQHELDALQKHPANHQIPAGQLQEDPHVLSWRETLNDLKYQYSKAVGRYTESNPIAKDLKNQLDKANLMLSQAIREAEANFRSDSKSGHKERMAELPKEISFESSLLDKLEQEQNELLDTVDEKVELLVQARDFAQLLTEAHERLKALQKKKLDLEDRMSDSRLSIDVISTATQEHNLTRSILQKWIMILLLSIFAAVGLCYIVEMLSTVVESEHDIRKYLNLPILMRIPKRRPREPKVLSEMKSNEGFAELFKNLALIIGNKMTQKKMNVMEITSTGKEEGKSTIASNLAISLARLDHKVLLIDCDLRAPSLHKMLKLDKRGLFNYVQQCIADDKYLEPDSFMQRPLDEPNLSVLCAGANVENPLLTLRHNVFRQMIATVRDQYEFIILDTPPITHAAEAMLLAEIVDTIYMVVAQGETNKKEAKEAVQILNNAGFEMNGIIFNKSYHHPFSGHGYYYKYYYSYSYGNRGRKK